MNAIGDTDDFVGMDAHMGADGQTVAAAAQMPAESRGKAAGRKSLPQLKGWQYSLLAFLVSALAVLAAFSMANRMLFSSYTVMEGDYFMQEVPFYIEFLRKLFRSGDLTGIGNFWYSFQYSMGSEVYAQYDIFSCFSPFVLFYLIPDANIASICMLVGKLATAGCFFQVFCRKCLRRDGFVTVVFSAAYALCGYSTVFYVNVAFLEGVYMLPLVLYLAYRLVTGKKWMGLSFAYAYLFINCFYEGYIVGIFSALALVLFLFLVWEGEKAQKWERIGLFALSAAFAVLVSSFLLLPTAVYVLSNIAEDVSVFDGLKLNPLDILGNLFLGMNQGREGVMPYLYSGLFVLFTTPFFFLSKAVPRGYKIFAGALLEFLLLCCLADPLYLFMHCFDNPDTSGFRFAYMISFLLLAVGVSVFDLCRTCITKKMVILTGAAWAGVLVLVYILQQRTWEEEYQSMSVFMLELNLIFLGAYAAYLLLQGKFRSARGSRTFFSVFCCLEVIFNAYLVLIMIDYSDSEYLFSYDLMTAQNQQVFEEISETEGAAFYRSSMDQSISPNLLMLYGQKGIDSFSSFENALLRETMTKLGYATTTRIVYDYGGTDFTRMIFSQKYKVTSYSVPYNNLVIVPSYEEQEECLGLGFLCSAALYDVELTDLAPKNQNLLLSAMAGIDGSMYKPVDSEVSCDLTDIVYSYGELDGEGFYAYVLQDGSESGQVAYTFAGEDDKTYYCYLPSEKVGLYLNYPIIYSEGGDVGYDITNSYTTLPHMLRLGKDGDGSYNVKLYIDDSMQSNYIPVDEIYFLYQDDEVLGEAYEILSGNQMQLEEVADGYVRGTVTATEEYPALFFSIPYEKGWKAYVDGEEAEIVPAVNGTFLTVEVPAGEHEVTLVYRNAYGEAGKWVSLGALLLMGGCLLWTKRHAPVPERSGAHEAE